jgi:DNA-binding CsgD family transcriptional regulator
MRLVHNVKRESTKNPAWLVEDERSAASALGPLLKKIVDARFVVLFPSIKGALAAGPGAQAPGVILLHGFCPADELEEIRAMYPGARLFVICAHEELRATRTPLGRAMVSLLRRKSEVVNHYYGLTIMERKILKFIVEGWIKKEIADHLLLSFHTVNNHERHIYQKLHVHTRSAAVAKALMEGLIA